MTVAEGRADIKSSKFIFSILTSGYRGYSGRKNRVPLTVTYDPNRNFVEVYDKCFATVSRKTGTEIGFGM